MNLELRPVYQTRDYESPFCPKLPGFNDQWWFGRSHRMVDAREILLSFDLYGEEVARAHLNPEARVADAYADSKSPITAVEVIFFEVRADVRGRGVGRAALDLVSQKFPGRLLTAFSENADGFWAAAGWSLRQRTDGAYGHRPFFVMQVPPASG